MHWSDKIAEKIIRRRPDKEEYVCAAGISPSGSIHIGNFRDIATSLFVTKALRRQGKKARLLFSWDEYDRFRKVPVNVAKIERPQGEKPWNISAVPMWMCPIPLTTGVPTMPSISRKSSRMPWSVSAFKWTTDIRRR